MNDLLFAKTRFSLLWTVFLNWTLTLFLCTVWRFCSLEAHHSEHSTGPDPFTLPSRFMSCRYAADQQENLGHGGKTFWFCLVVGFFWGSF